MAAARLISANVLAEELEPDGVSVALASASGTLTAHVASEVGLWEAGPGTDVDTESDEAFLVLAGAGLVEFEDASTLELRPGTLVRLHAGDRTTWHITERLRKLYVA